MQMIYPEDICWARRALASGRGVRPIRSGCPSAARLYPVREALGKDFPGTLQQLAASATR